MVLSSHSLTRNFEEKQISMTSFDIKIKKNGLIANDTTINHRSKHEYVDNYGSPNDLHQGLQYPRL